MTQSDSRADCRFDTTQVITGQFVQVKVILEQEGQNIAAISIDGKANGSGSADQTDAGQCFGIQGRQDISDLAQVAGHDRHLQVIKGCSLVAVHDDDGRGDGRHSQSGWRADIQDLVMLNISDDSDKHAHTACRRHFFFLLLLSSAFAA